LQSYKDVSSSPPTVNLFCSVFLVCRGPAFVDLHDIGKVKAALKAGKFSLTTKDQLGKDALLTASDFVRADIMALLLDEGASLQTKDYLGNTAFHYVLKEDNEPKPLLKALKLLIKRNIKAGNKVPSTARYSNSNQPHAVLYLIQ